MVLYTYVQTPTALLLQPSHLIVGLHCYLSFDRLPLADGQGLPEVKHRLLPVRVLRKWPGGKLNGLVQLPFAKAQKKKKKTIVPHETIKKTKREARGRTTTTTRTKKINHKQKKYDLRGN